MNKINSYRQLPQFAKLGRVHYAKKQKGMMILEAMVAIVIFALGIVGILGLGARAIASQSDAQYRAEATKFANQIIQIMDVGVERTSEADLRASLLEFNHQNAGAACDFSGLASTNLKVAAWVDGVINPSTGLPGARAEGIRIAVVNGIAPMPNLNQVQVTVCWKTPDSDAWRQHSMIGYIN